MNTPWIFRDTSPSVIGRRLGGNFEILSFKMRSQRTGYYLNVCIDYDYDNNTFEATLRTCGKYPKWFASSYPKPSLAAVLLWLSKFDDVETS